MSMRNVLWMQGVLDRGVFPHADAIEQITTTGGVAGVVWSLNPSLHDGARALGWDALSPVFRLDCVRYRAVLEAAHDERACRWLESARSGRVVVFADLGAFLVNWESHWLTFEPDDRGGVPVRPINGPPEKAKSN